MPLHATDSMEISLSDIVKPIVNARRFIAYFTALVVIACLGLAFYLAKYESESRYYFGSSTRLSADNEAGGLKEEVYDRILSSAKTLARFDAYLMVL